MAARCDHLAFRNPVVDWQIWIGQADRPLPHRSVITTRGDLERPQCSVHMSEWNEKPTGKAPTFRLSIPKDAEQIEFLTPDRADASARCPSARSRHPSQQAARRRRSTA